MFAVSSAVIRTLLASRAWLAAAVLAIASPVGAQTADTPGLTAFVGVNVVPMDSERVLEKQTVVVEGTRIKTLGPASEVSVPAGALKIPGEGRFLIPGLADMHTHLTGPSQPLPPRELLRNYLREGVTTIRLLGGTEEDKQLRDAVRRGELVGPTVITAGKTIVGEPDFMRPEKYLFSAKVAGLFLALGLTLSLALWLTRRHQRRPPGRARRALALGCGALAALGAGLVWLDVIPFAWELERQFHWCKVVRSEESIRAEVRRRKAEGYDVVKVYDYLSKPLYYAALDEARKQGLYAVGHVPDQMSVEEVLEGGLNEIAHADEIMTDHMPANVEPNKGFKEVSFDASRIPRTAAAVARHGAMVVSNITADEVAYELIEGPSQLLARPQYALVSRETIRSWSTEGRAVGWQGQQSWRRNTMQPYLKNVVRELHAAGVPLLIGTDVSVEGLLPWHIHRELELLVEVGLTPYQALRAGTVNAGESLRRAGLGGEVGQVKVGNTADLVLLEANPLEKITATRRRVGTMARGRWYPESELASTESGRASAAQ